MGILKNQTAARIIIRSNLNLNSTNIISASIRYLKPSGISGTWPATILPAGKTTGDLYIDFSDNLKYDEKGVWTLSVNLIFEDGREAPGENVLYDVKESV